MKPYLVKFLPIVLCLAITGCVPIHSTVNKCPTVQGQVVSSTGQPIKGAVICLVGHPDTACLTDEQGKFRLRSQSNHPAMASLLVPTLYLNEPVSYGNHLAVYAQGFQSFSQLHAWGNVHPEVIELPSITLEHKPTLLPVPESLQITTKSAISLKWKKVPGAGEYLLQRFDYGLRDWVTFTQVAEPEATLTNLTHATMQNLRLSAQGGTWVYFDVLVP